MGSHGEIFVTTVTARNHLDTDTTSVDKSRDQLPQLGTCHPVSCRVGNHRLATSRGNPANRIGQVCPFTFHETGLTLDQVMLEDAAHRIGMAGLHQGACKVRTADQPAVRISSSQLENTLDTRLGQAPPHLFGSPVAKTPHAGQAFLQSWMLWIDTQSHDVYRATIPGNRYLDARHKAQPQRLRLRGRLRQAFQRVVVSQRHHLDTRFMRTPHQLGRAERAVRSGRMSVQVMNRFHIRHFIPAAAPGPQNKRYLAGFTQPDRRIDFAAMKPDSVDIAYLYESFCEFTENLQEAWENSAHADIDEGLPQRLIDAMSQLAGILRSIEDAGELPPGTNQDVHTLGEYGLQLLSELSEIAAKLSQDEPARGLENLCLPMAVWTARHGGEIRHLEPVVNALAYFAEHGTEADFMVQLLSLTNEVYDAVSPRLIEENPGDLSRPWRMLVLNRAVIATRTMNPAMIEPVFDSIVEHLPDDAARFFEEGMEQMDVVGYPQPVRDIMNRYFQAFGPRRVLH